MADLLIVSPSLKEQDALTRLAEAKGFRVRATKDPKIAEQWASTRTFDLAFVHSSTPIKAQQRIAEKFWERKLTALFYVFGREEERNDHPELRLYGAEIARGSDYLTQLEHILDKSVPLTKSPEDLKVLVVEDLDSPREILCIFLESLGYHNYESVSSGSEGLRALASSPEKFSCVITDFRMPQMAGDAFIREVRRDPYFRDLPILVLTAYGTLDCLIDCLKAGATGFLVKPPKRKDLERELGRAHRIALNQLDPRLVAREEAESLRALLETRLSVG